MTTTRPHGPDCCEVTNPPAYLDPVRHELDRLRATLARVQRVADEWVPASYHSDDRCVACAFLLDLRAALADKEPTP